MMKKILGLMLTVVCAFTGAQAAVTPVAGSTTPKVSTSEAPVWYTLMSSHMTETDRQNRFLKYNGTTIVTEQFSAGVPQAVLSGDYMWRLESAGDGTDSHVYLVNKSSGLRISVPSGATAEDGSSNVNTPLVMNSTGTVWDLQLSSSTGLSSDCAANQYCFKYIGYSGARAYFNAMGLGSDYGVTIYAAGVHQASGWFFYEAHLDEEEGGGDEEISGEAGEYIVENPFETMIRLGRMNDSNPIYTMPSGNGGSAYITSAITTGNGVMYPLGYVAGSQPGKHFVIVSKATSLVTQGEAFDLVITENVSPSSQTVTMYTDWNRDGVYEDAATEPVIDASAKSIKQTFNVPDDAKLGKTRIRVRIESSESSSANANVSGGRVYDFVIYVMEGDGDRTDAFVSVSSSDSDLGSAYIVTEANESGRYEIGSEVTVEAVINEDAAGAVTFEGWYLGDELVSEDLQYTFEVSGSTYLIARFSIPEPVLEAPVVSTADNPVWYQIMNAHTAAERSERCIAYDVNTDATYSTVLRAEKPADTTDKYLWRLEDAGNGYVYLINRGSDLRISCNSTEINAQFTVSETGSKFLIQPSGNSNGSYTIVYEGMNEKYMNAQDGLWAIVIYNAGIGTGSGWYFYRVDVSEPSGIENAVADETTVKGTLDNGKVTLFNAPEGGKVTAVSLSGQLLGTYPVTSAYSEYDIKYPERFVIVVVEDENGAKTILKLYDK